MKIKNLKYIAVAAVLGMGTISCEDFLDRPQEDGYNESNFYQNDEQCIQGVNYLYNSPWYDYQRGFIKVAEVLSGNYYMGGEKYLNFSVNGTDASLVDMSYALWAVNGHANTVYNRLKTANASQAVKTSVWASVSLGKPWLTSTWYAHLVRCPLCTTILPNWLVETIIPSSK